MKTCVWAKATCTTFITLHKTGKVSGDGLKEIAISVSGVKTIRRMMSRNTAKRKLERN